MIHKKGRLCIYCEFHVLQSSDVTEETVKRCKEKLFQDQSITLLPGRTAVDWGSICDRFKEKSSDR